MKIRYGMTPAMFDAYIRAMYLTGINPEKRGDGGRRLVQTAPKPGAKKVGASAGTHDLQGEVTDSSGNKIPFGVAIDIGIKDLSLNQIKKLLLELAKQGYVGWYRYQGSFAGANRHVHAVYCGHYIKDYVVYMQIIDYLNNRTGLVGPKQEKFYTAPTAIDAVLAQMFARSNPDKKHLIPKDLLKKYEVTIK
jgi:hypothetical protein